MHIITLRSRIADLEIIFGSTPLVVCSHPDLVSTDSKSPCRVLPLWEQVALIAEDVAIWLSLKFDSQWDLLVLVPVNINFSGRHHSGGVNGIGRVSSLNDRQEGFGLRCPTAYNGVLDSPASIGVEYIKGYLARPSRLPPWEWPFRWKVSHF